MRKPVVSVEKNQEDEYRIPPGEGDRYWNEFGEEQFYEG